MTIEQIGICEAVGSHFKIKKAEVRATAQAYLDAVGADHPVLGIELKDDTKLSFGISKNTLDLGKMLVYDTFSKSKLYSDCLNLINNEGVSAVAFYHYDKARNRTLMVVHEAVEYTGLGGMFVRPQTSKWGFAIEPMKLFLKNEYPIYLEE